MAKRLLLLALIVIVAAVGCKEEYSEIPVAATSTPSVGVTPTLALPDGGQYLKNKEMFSVGVDALTYENLYWDSHGNPGVYGSGLLGTVPCDGGSYGLYVIGTSSTNPCDVAIAFFYVMEDSIQVFPNLQANATILKELK